MPLTQFTHIIKSVCHTFFSSNAARNTDILIYRFGLDGRNPETLEQIGERYNLTRERIRQIEEQTQRILSEIFITGKYIKRFVKKEKSYYLERDVYQSIQTIISDLLLNHLYHSVDEIRNYFGVNFNAYQGEIMLLLSCLGYEWHKIKTRFTLCDGWIYYKKKDTITQFMTQLNQLPPNKQESLNSFLSKHKIHLKIEQSLLILENINGIKISENTENDYSIQIDFDNLNTMDKVYFLLSQTNTKLSIDEITEYLNRKSGRSYQPNNIRNQMSNDERFTPIGKSGCWALLDQSKLKNISIADAIDEVFLTQNKPLHKAEIILGVRALRGDSFQEKSITTYLNTDNRFCSLGKGMFALTDWKLPIITAKRNAQRKNGFEQDLLDFMGLNTPHLLINVVRHFTQKDWNEVTVRCRLIKLVKKGVISIQEEKNHKKITLLKDPILKDPCVYINKKQNGIIVMLQNKILTYLSQHPNQAITKGELYKAIDPNKEYIIQTFYQSLSRIDNENLHSYIENNKFYVIFKPTN